MAEETIDSRVVTGINDPSIAEKANLPNPFQLEATRTVAGQSREYADSMVAQDEGIARSREQRQSQKNGLQIALEKLGWGRKEREATQERFAKVSEEHKRAAEEAVKREMEIRQAIELLTPEEQSKIVEERYNDATRVQTIAIGLTIAKKLEAQGIDSKEWGRDYAASTVGKEDENKRKVIEDTIKAFEEGSITIEPEDYKKASNIYDQWVQRMAGDVENMLDGSNMRKFSAISFESSLNAMANPKKLAAEGVAQGGWFSS